MKTQPSFNDARLKIKGNVADARQTIKSRQLLSKAKQFDARLKITGRSKIQLKPGQQNLKPAANKVPLRRTINNNGSGILISRTLKSSLQSNAKATVSRNIKRPAPTGFISVNNGERTLMEKVTMHRTGMKIAVRNEFALNKPKKNLPEKRKMDKTIRITLENPVAQKVLKKPMKQMAKTPTYIATAPVRKQQRKRPQPYQPLRERHNTSPNSAASADQSDVTEIRFLHNTSRAQNKGLRPMKFKKLDKVQPSNKTAEAVQENKVKTTKESFSPLEGTKISVSNLHPVVVEDDILELFSVLGPVRRARLVGPGKAEVVFVRRDDAVQAYQKYNNRDLDGQPMRMKLQLREPQTPRNLNYSWMKEIGGTEKKTDAIEIDSGVLQRALFKGGSTGTSSRPVVFTVKI